MTAKPEKNAFRASSGQISRELTLSGGLVRGFSGSEDLP